MYSTENNRCAYFILARLFFIVTDYIEESFKVTHLHEAPDDE